MNKRRVVISGMGLVCPLAATLDGFWNQLISRKGAVRPWSIDTEVPALIDVAAPALFDEKIEDFESRDPAQKKMIKKGLKVMSREIQMAVAASCRALNHAELSIGQFPPDRIGVSIGSDYILTTSDDLIDGIRACMQTVDGVGTFDFSRWAPDGLTKMPPLWQLKYLPNMPASHIAILNNFHGPSNSITLREASIGAVGAEAVEIIAASRADIMLIGTTGSRLHPLKMIHAVQQEEISKTECRPFAANRSGTVLGEGAGAIVLEEYEHAKRRGAEIFAEAVVGSTRIRYGRGETDLRREAIGASLRDVLRRGQMEPENVGHINAHGLGTQISDRLEAEAIDDVFGKRKKPIQVTAAKGYFGNLGAGGGAVELIAGVLSLQKNVAFPMLHNVEAAPDCPILPVVDADVPAGDSFVKIAMNPQGQASTVLVRKI